MYTYAHTYVLYINEILCMFYICSCVHVCVCVCFHWMYLPQTLWNIKITSLFIVKVIVCALEVLNVSLTLTLEDLFLFMFSIFVRCRAAISGWHQAVACIRWVLLSSKWMKNWPLALNLFFGISCLCLYTFERFCCRNIGFSFPFEED